MYIYIYIYIVFAVRWYIPETVQRRQGVLYRHPVRLFFAGNLYCRNCYFFVVINLLFVFFVFCSFLHLFVEYSIVFTCFGIRPVFFLIGSWG